MTDFLDTPPPDCPLKRKLIHMAMDVLMDCYMCDERDAQSIVKDAEAAILETKEMF